MLKILLNYDYSQYPYTTATYFEKAGKLIEGVKIFRKDELSSISPDLIINVMPAPEIISLPGVPSCYYEIDDHLVLGQEDEKYAAVDHVFVAQSPFLEYYPPEKTTYLPLACDPIEHHLFEGKEQRFDIGFIGNDTYPPRRLLLDLLAQNFITLRTNTLPGLPYSEALSACKLTFNRSLNQDVNMRFFEAMAVGRMLLTDYLPAQNEFAKDGVHYVSYNGWEDLKEKVSYYLTHEDEREKIALAGRNHITKNHTYKIRLEKIIEVMKCKIS